MTVTESNIIFAFAMTLIAGASTGIGSLIAFFSKKTGPRFMALCMGFSAGVMIYVSMGEILLKGKRYLMSAYGERTGYFVTIISFFAGMALLEILNKVIPESSVQEKGGMVKAGLFTALAIAIHNLPEGMATFISSLGDPALALPVVFAIAIHNIPEGISVSVPLVCGGMGRKRAFLVSFVSGLTEPLGAMLGYLILFPFMNDDIYGILFSAVAGIMVYISFDELIPTAEKSGYHGITMVGLVGGMITMAVSLGLFIN